MRLKFEKKLKIRLDLTNLNKVFIFHLCLEHHEKFEREMISLHSVQHLEYFFSNTIPTTSTLSDGVLDAGVQLFCGSLFIIAAFGGLLLGSSGAAGY